MISAIYDTLKRLLKSTNIRAIQSSIRTDRYVHTTPQPRLEYLWLGNRQQNGGVLVFWFLCLFLVIPIMFLLLWLGYQKEYEECGNWDFTACILCSFLLLHKIKKKNALVQINVVYFFWTNQMKVFLSYLYLIMFYINKSFYMANREESCPSVSTVVQ